MTNIGYRGEDMPESYHGYEVGTFPRKRETPRFRYVYTLSFRSTFLILKKILKIHHTHMCCSCLTN